MKLLYVVLMSLIPLLNACAILASTSEKAAINAGKGIAEYCKLPAETRLQFRDRVNKHAAPHSASINCQM